MPDRSLAEINADLQAKQAEIDDLTSDGAFRETVDGIVEDLGDVIEFIEETITGITEAGESLEENFEELSGAIDDMNELLGTDAFASSVEAGGEFVEGVTGGLESVTNVTGEVQEGLESLADALEAVQAVDDLAGADGAAALEAFADAFELVVDRLGPLVDRIPVLGAFFRLYGAGIRNIAVSAGQMEAIVDRNQALYLDISGGGSLYLTPEYLASEELRRLQAEYDALFEEALDAAAAEQEARGTPPAGSAFDPVKHVLYTALDRCAGLLPDYHSPAFRKYLRAKVALDSAEFNASQARGALEVVNQTGYGDAAREQQNVEEAEAQHDAAREAFDTDGAEHRAALDAYDDCVKRHIFIFSGYEGLDDWEIKSIGVDHPQWDIRGWEPSVVVPVETSRCSRRDAAVAVIGGAMLAGGLFLLTNVGTNPLSGVASAFTQVSSSDAMFPPFGRQVVVDVRVAAVDPSDDPAVSTGDDTSGTQAEPTVDSSCSGTDHYPEVPATDGEGNTTNSLSKQVIGAYVTGLPPGTVLIMDVAGVGTTIGVVNNQGYVEFQVPLNSYGTYTITSVGAFIFGRAVSLDPTLLGSPFRVTGAEQGCGQSMLSPPPTTTTTTTSTTTTTLAPTSISVNAGGGAVQIPPATSTGGGATVITPGTPETPGSDVDAGTLVLGVGLLVSGAALLGGVGAPGMSACDDEDRVAYTPFTGPRTYTAEDRAFLQEIYKGADEAGVNIVGISQVRSLDDALAGSKANPVVIGKSATIYVRVGADGSMLPRREDSDTAAASIVKIDVRPGVEFDGDGDRHIVWHSHVTQIDVETAEIVDASSAGPSSAEWEAKVDGRSDVEVGNDPAFKDWVVESMPDSPGEAVRQALSGAGLVQ
ncbi:MAG: hypothetical protein DRJ28_02680 [Actinobacteria bacterium]|nr:MAG: hypothetical protein DRJ28_02680 [Actinomycetota bacterium]